MAREPRQRRRTLYGALLTAGLVAAAVLIFFLDILIHAFDRNYAIHVIMPATGGLVEDSPVWVSGREIGTVTSIGFLPSSQDTLARVFVTVQLPTSVQSQIREDSEVRVTSIGFISEKVIDIASGTAASPALSPGDTLRVDPRLTPVQLTAQAAAVKKELDEVLAGLRSHSPAMRARMLQMDQALTGLDAMMLEAAALQEDVDASPAFAVLRDPVFRASLDRTRSYTTELGALLARVREPAGSAAEVRAALARLQLRADSLGAQLAAASAALENPNGTLARIQQDSALIRAIGAARAELDSLIADARRNPLRFVF